MKISILDQQYAICRLKSDAPVLEWMKSSGFTSITRTNEELSIVCEESAVPSDVKTEKGWKIFKVEGPLDFGLTGILASIATPLAAHKISIFALSTFDTDYIMVKNSDARKAQTVLESSGFSFH